MMAINIPIAFYRNLATYGYRFGVKKSSAGTALPCATDDPQQAPK